ncbi:bestrophin family protein [Portibacter marinus]|uniref:bestrophin family protein n=1 Tax=Portibacter marinus TaxID=2898660 RepID=UPI001F28C630|nr:bestrophin family ion channel [Portibacter marinus]
MYVQKNLSFKGIINFSGGHLIWITLWTLTVVLLHEFTSSAWMSIPWLPISIIGTAVAFYVGFKNNQAYGRLWEARKIWGAIVNSSRAWGSAVKAFVNDTFLDDKGEQENLYKIHKKLIYRHIAWLYALRNQLLIPTSWEHINQHPMIARVNRRRQKNYGVGLIDDGEIEDVLSEFLEPEEQQELINFKNTATQIIDQQAQNLASLRKQNFIDDFRHMELQKILYDFYIHQGKAERIKKFPLPRQYGGASFIFTGIFIFLLPFGMVSEFHKLGEWGVWISIPFTVLICWVYIMMELIGDYSENPFEGLGNDIPMMSLCRVIEIDLKEMLRETDIPPNIEAKNGVLM